MQIDEITMMEPPGMRLGAVHEFLETATRNGKLDSCRSMLSRLLDEHEIIIASLRKNIHACDERSGRRGTMDFLATLLEQHEAIVGILMRYMNKAVLLTRTGHDMLQ